jgi:hypothetical protein
MCRTGYEISTMSTGSPPSFLTGPFIRNNKNRLSFFSLKMEHCDPRHSPARPVSRWEMDIDPRELKKHGGQVFFVLSSVAVLDPNPDP